VAVALSAEKLTRGSEVAAGREERRRPEVTSRSRDESVDILI
jgi:hypothetical protein